MIATDILTDRERTILHAARDLHAQGIYPSRACLYRFTGLNPDGVMRRLADMGLWPCAIQPKGTPARRVGIRIGGRKGARS